MVLIVYPLNNTFFNFLQGKFLPSRVGMRNEFASRKFFRRSGFIDINMGEIRADNRVQTIVVPAHLDPSTFAPVPLYAKKTSIESSPKNSLNFLTLLFLCNRLLRMILRGLDLAFASKASIISGMYTGSNCHWQMWASFLHETLVDCVGLKIKIKLNCVKNYISKGR